MQPVPYWQSTVDLQPLTQSISPIDPINAEPNCGPFIYGSALMGYVLCMLKIFYLSAIFLLSGLTGQIAHAASCEALAHARIRANPGAQILGVRMEKDSYGATICVVTVREKGKSGGRPRVVTRKFKP